MDEFGDRRTKDYRKKTLKTTLRPLGGKEWLVRIYVSLRGKMSDSDDESDDESEEDSEEESEQESGQKTFSDRTVAVPRCATARRGARVLTARARARVAPAPAAAGRARARTYSTVHIALFILSYREPA